MTTKCIVKGCDNHTHQGYFIGDLCVPCYHMLSKGEIGNGRTFIHSLAHNNQALLEFIRAVRKNTDEEVDKLVKKLEII